MEMMTKTKIVLTMLMMIPMNNNISGCRSFDCCVEIQNDVVTRSPINFIGVDVVSFYHLTSPRRVGSYSVMPPSSCHRRRAVVPSSRQVVALFVLSSSCRHRFVASCRRVVSSLRWSCRRRGAAVASRRINRPPYHRQRCRPSGVVKRGAPHSQGRHR